MKKRILSILILIVVLISVFSINTFAYSSKKYNFTAKEPSGYTVIDQDNVKSHQDFLQKINYEASGFVDYLTKNNIVFYAINKQNGNEITLKCITSDFSKDIDDMSLLSDTTLSSIAKELVKDRNYTICEKNGNKYIKVPFNSDNADENFFGTQYITVKNSNLYSVSFTFSGSTSDITASTVENAFLGDFYIENKSEFSWSNFGDIILIVIIAIVILAFLIVAIYVIYTFIVDIRAKNSSNDVAPYVKIKRRKF